MIQQLDVVLSSLAASPALIGPNYMLNNNTVHSCAASKKTISQIGACELLLCPPASK